MIALSWRELIFSLIRSTDRKYILQLDYSIRVFDCSIRVYRCIVNAAWYLYRGLSPSPHKPEVPPPLNNAPYNIIMYATGDIISMVITNGALMIINYINKCLTGAGIDGRYLKSLLHLDLHTYVGSEVFSSHSANFDKTVSYARRIPCQ